VTFPWPILLILLPVFALTAWVVLADKRWAFADQPLWARLGYLILLALMIGGVLVWSLGRQS
jgi:hypothetical protein